MSATRNKIQERLHSMKKKIKFGLFIVFLIITGCDSTTVEEDPEVNGYYSDTITTPSGISAELVVILDDQNGNISGVGDLTSSNAKIEFQISGTHNFPKISLTFSTPGFVPFKLSGEVSNDGDRISGELDGSELDGTDVTFVREWE